MQQPTVDNLLYLYISICNNIFIINKQNKYMKDKILEYLENEPRFRERKNKNKGIANLINKKYKDIIPENLRDSIIDDILSADRYWRWWLEDGKRPDLRGKDYNTKNVIMSKAENKLGYGRKLSDIELYAIAFFNSLPIKNNN